MVTLKLHMLIGYSTKLGLLRVRSALITKGSAHDSPRLKRLLRGVRGNGKPLLLDAGYDSEDNYRLGKKTLVWSSDQAQGRGAKEAYQARDGEGLQRTKTSTDCEVSSRPSSEDLKRSTETA